MRKPVSEHSTTIKARKGEPKRADRMEAVGGGKVRRVEFEGDQPAPVTRTEREWRPRTHESIDDIHFEIDNLERMRRGAPPRAKRRTERRVLETTRGGVTEARVKTDGGEKQVLYTSRQRGSRQEEHRFHSGMVDRVLARSASNQKLEPPRRMPRRKASKPAPEPAPVELQPQCEAITQAGVQCRNSAKAGSTYCGSHQGHKPQRLEDILDTKPTRGADTLPGAGDQVGTGQCVAYTQQGLQCRNSSRKNSKYCAPHKGYRAPSKASLEKRLDTKPRHAGAKDTTPKMRA